MTRSDTVYVETYARLHFGVLDLRGTSGRWFGGIGASAPAPTLLVSASPAPTLEVTGNDAGRATAIANRFLAHFDLRQGARIQVHRSLRPHAGLGSGTQLALAIARALAEMSGIAPDVTTLAHAVGRGQRSAIGIWTFEGPGLVVEGGRRRDSTAMGPLIARLPFPDTWRCVLAVPHIGSDVSGALEAAAFDRLPAPPEEEVGQVAHIVLMSLLPALAEGNLADFGMALATIQDVTGKWFASIQGGPYAGAAAALVRRMRDWGASGVGQSSWGPAVYALVEGDRAAERLAECVRAHDAAVDVFTGPFPRTGARVWRE